MLEAIMDVLGRVLCLPFLATPSAFQDVSATHLPVEGLQGLSMDVAAADLDGDGDLDVLVANEHRPNIYLLNDGSGRFSLNSEQIPQQARDSEDIGLADFDGDGDIDVLVVSEDDEFNELYLNRGDGSFVSASDRLPVAGISNAVAVLDVDLNGAPDILIGNNGQNALLLNDGTAHFKDGGAGRLPLANDVTQDIAVGDLNGDGHPDLVLANEGFNKVLINSGNGVFRDESPARLVYRAEPEETREIALGDVDGDGDLDIFFANVEAFVPGALRQNRLLLNRGDGYFSDATDRLPADQDRSFTAVFFDIDADGDLDIVTGNVNGPRLDGETPYRVYVNSGEALFEDQTSRFMPPSASGRGFDILFEDFNGDGKADIYLANRGGTDRLLIARRSAESQ